MKKQVQDIVKPKFERKYDIRADYILNIENLSKEFGNRTILKDLDFKIKRKEKVAIVGANGSGKTTLVNILLGLMSGTSGKITYKSMEQDKFRRFISTQHQTVDYPEGYTVYETLKMFYGIEKRKVTDPILGIDRIIETFSLSDILNRKMARLSGGEKQKINLAITFIQTAEIIILDELQTGLDVLTYEKVLVFLKEYIRKYDSTLIIISHNLNEVKQFTNTVYLLKDKVLTKKGPSKKVTPLMFHNWIKSSSSTNSIELKKDVDYSQLWYKKAMDKISKKDHKDDEPNKLQLWATKYIDKVKIDSLTKKKQNKLVLENVNKKFGNEYALKDVNMSIKPGERVAIVGGNGAGKTTLIEIISQVQKQSSGKISYWWTKYPMNANTKIGTQFQISSFPDDLKVKELLDLFAEINKESLKKSEIINLVETLNLQDVYNSYANSLSGGQRQKLNILIAFLKKPEMIILDEISTGLDVVSQDEIVKIIDQYIKTFKKTLILVSHNPKEVKKLADVAYIVRDGKVSKKPVQIKGKSVKAIADIMYKAMT